MKKIIVFIIGLLFFMVGCSSSNSSEKQENGGLSTPRFCGSFLQPWLSSDWDMARWEQEMNMLKKAGIQYLIYGPAWNMDIDGQLITCYPSKLFSPSTQNESIGKCLESAHKYGIKILLGLNFNDKWWDSNVSADWLVSQMNIGNSVADELLSLYKSKYGDTMYGWYWVWEVDNVNWISNDRQVALINALNTNLEHLSSVCPDMPLWLSPFMNEKAGGLDADGYKKFWINIFAQANFRKGDVFVPQDCVGAGGLELSTVSMWFLKLKQAVETKPGLKFWGNVETFISPYGVSAPLSRVVGQLKAEKPYVENFISFAYDHYDSPFVVHGDYNDSYIYYCNKGVLPLLPAPQPVKSVTVSKVDEGVKVSWVADDFAQAAGYNIYRDGILIMMLQKRGGDYPAEYVDKQSSAVGSYEVSVYNAVGNESSKVKNK
jgi:hypothetical protein